MEFPERIEIKSHTINIVPRYSETDQGGFVHHSVYPVWFEMGRTELLRLWHGHLGRVLHGLEARATPEFMYPAEVV